MVLKLLATLCVLIACVSCSDSDKSTPVPTAETPAVTPAPTPVPALPPVIEPPTFDNAPVVNEKYVDPYTSVLIQEIKNQLSNDPLSHVKRIQNVEFANRIYKVNFKYHERQSRLSLVTHSAKAFEFELTSKKGNIQYFNAYSEKKGLFENKNRSVIYTAEANHLEKSPKDKKVVIIKIKDVEANTIVHVFYILKKGKLTTIPTRGYDYPKELTDTSKIFEQRLIKNPEVVGEFYGIITEERNISNASRFILTISDNFTLESLPVTGHYTPDQPLSIPLMVSYKSFWKTFFLGSVAYTVGSDFSYVIESERKPVELTALNIDLRIQAKEKIEGQKNTLPLRLFIQFK